LTPIEVKKLRRQLWEALALEYEVFADDYLTEQEEADLYWAERDLNRSIRREMNDYQVW
jgi:hypothetical protein